MSGVLNLNPAGIAAVATLSLQSIVGTLSELGRVRMQARFRVALFTDIVLTLSLLSVWIARVFGVLPPPP